MVLKEGTFPPSQLLFVDGEQPKVIWSHVRTIGRMGQNLDGLLHWESYSELNFVGSYRRNAENKTFCAQLQ